MITAKEAYHVAKVKNSQTTWDKLFARIEENANNGKFSLIFDEEIEKAHFSEHRKEVQKKLEDLGYNVYYERVKDRDYYNGYNYHNQYKIIWDEV